LIIGITGTIGAGKGTIVEYLKQKGFNHYSVRAYITEEIVKRGLAVNRDNMVIAGNDLRAKNSPSYIVEQLYEKARKEGKNCIIESVRTIGEVEGLKKKGKFFLFAVDAEPKTRYERIVKRGSETDKITFDVFLENEKREMNGTDPNKQNIGACMKMADHLFQNNGTIKELYNKVEEVLKKLK
jgi:dephospho-CoA kinase